jgi:hypothetical protein
VGATLAPGSLDDRVKLVLTTQDGTQEQIFVAEAWNVKQGVLETPGAFTLTLGQSIPFASLFTSQGRGPYPNGPKFPKGSPFQLQIGDAPQFSGRVEGYLLGGKATRLTIKGRDQLAALMRTHPVEQHSFLDGTYEDLVKWALQTAGVNATLFNKGADQALLRSVQAGIKVKVYNDPTLVDQINAQGTAGSSGPNVGGVTIGAVVHQEKRNRIHEPLMSFIRRHLDRAGLFLCAGVTPDACLLFQPNPNQDPIARIIRVRAQQKASNVVDFQYVDDATHRHGLCAVWGRGGGRSAGRVKAKGQAIDGEMAAYSKLTGSGWATQALCCRDVNVENLQQAEFYARRRLAEERRAGWSLTYTIRGHRLENMDGTDWVVATPDTNVYVKDDEIGLDGVYYVESVERERRPETITHVRLMRLVDLIFGDSEID